MIQITAAGDFNPAKFKSNSSDVLKTEQLSRKTDVFIIAPI